MPHEPPTQANPPDYLLHAFDAARAEVLKHIELRDRMLTTSCTISTAILGSTMLSRDSMIGMLVPVVGLGATLVVCQHTVAIHEICCWTRQLLPIHWARSKELRLLHARAIPERAMAQGAFFVAPALVALAYGYGAAFAEASVLLSGLWWAGVLLVACGLFVQWRTFSSVIAINRATGYEDAPVTLPPEPPSPAKTSSKPSNGAALARPPKLGPNSLKRHDPGEDVRAP